MIDIHPLIYMSALLLGIVWATSLDPCRCRSAKSHQTCNAIFAVGLISVPGLRNIWQTWNAIRHWSPICVSGLYSFGTPATVCKHFQSAWGWWRMREKIFEGIFLPEKTFSSFAKGYTSRTSMAAPKSRHCLLCQYLRLTIVNLELLLILGKLEGFLYFGFRHSHFAQSLGHILQAFGFTFS